MQIEILELDELFPQIQLKFSVRDPRPKNKISYIDTLYYTSMNACVVEGNMLKSICGWGENFDETLLDICKTISNETIRLDSEFGSNEIKLPTIVHTKLLNK